MAEPFLGQIMMFGGNFAPLNWAMCNGQTMSISQYTALFSILGTTYGGNGVQTFQLPNLQGRVPVGMGSGAGLPTYVQGQVGGAATVTLLATNLPVHAHTFAPAISSAPADQNDPTGAIPAMSNYGGNPSARPPVPGTPTPSYTKTASTGVGLTQQTGAAGSSQPVNIEPPYIAMNYIIALAGIYPSRN
jgi:microcystin-dependent protein